MENIKNANKSKRTKYTWDYCLSVAKKFQTKSDFQLSKEGNLVYQHLYKSGQLDKACEHMTAIYQDQPERLVYSIIFPNNQVYIGLTQNIKSRIIGHKYSSGSAIYNHFKLYSDYILTIESDLMDVKDGVKMEANTIEKYSKLGFTILNKNKAGGLGTVRGDRKTKYRRNSENAIQIKNKKK